MRGAIRDYWQGFILFLRTPTLGRSVALLRAEGFQARKLLDGVSEWRAAGLALAD